MSKELTPPDRERCQADVPNGYSFMTLGGRPGRVRCSCPTNVIVREVAPGKDGLIGSMGLCYACLDVLGKQMPGHATVIETVRVLHEKDCGSVHGSVEQT